MPKEPCGCTCKEHPSDAEWCSLHEEHGQKAVRIAWKLSKKEGILFYEAWSRLWELVISRWIKTFLGDLKNVVE